MADSKTRALQLLLSISVLLNVLLIVALKRPWFDTHQHHHLVQHESHNYYGTIRSVTDEYNSPSPSPSPSADDDDGIVQPGWSRSAADAAEKAALFDCNGNGDLYTDTLFSDDDDAAAADDDDDENNTRCECYECYTGSHCESLVPDCDANVNSGDPLFFAPYWKQNAKESALVIPGWYRIGYELVEGSYSSLSLTPALEREIRTLHTLVGNAVVKDKYIVLGVGSMQLINAAISCLATTSTMTTLQQPASVVSAVPYYGAYQAQTEMFQNMYYSWAGDANDFVDTHNNDSNTIELVTSPNNPDGVIRHAVLNGSNALTIYDLAYYWPHFTQITEARDDDVMLFTLSKVTGHAGSRIGWVIVKDTALYTQLMYYVQMNILAVPHESQLRATQLLRSINKSYSKRKRSSEQIPTNLTPTEYSNHGLSFHYAYATLHYRWEKLKSTLNGSNNFKLQELEPSYCNFFGEVVGPSPAYAWLHCEDDNNEDCSSIIKKAGIYARNGSSFGSSNQYVRLSLIKRDSVFENLINHLSTLVTPNTSQNDYLEIS